MFRLHCIVFICINVVVNTHMHRVAFFIWFRIYVLISVLKIVLAKTDRFIELTQIYLYYAMIHFEVSANRII